MSTPNHHPTVENLKRVLEVTRGLAASFELQPLLEDVAHAAQDVLHCERATVFLLDHDRNELYSKVATGVDEIRFPADRGIAGQVATSGQISIVPDAYADPRFNPEIDKTTGFKTRNIFTIPLDGLDGKRIGILQVLNKTDGDFTPEDEYLATALGAQAGVALQRQILLDQYAQKLHLEHELDIARDIQQALLPEKNPDLPGYDIAGWNKPADQTGGDCYDFINMQGHRLCILLADATGHGITAAMCIAQFRALVKATSRMSDDLSRIATYVNDLLTEDLPSDRFVTCFVGTLDPEAHELSYIAAGQGPLLHFHAATETADVLTASDLPMGIMDAHLFEMHNVLEIAPRDMVVLLTDGFFEWCGPDSEQFGEDRVIQVLKESKDLSSAEIIQRIYDAVRAFVGSAPQSDDLTAVIIKRITP